VNVPNNATMGINYSKDGSGIYFRDLSETGNEGDACWSCHELKNSTTALEFDGSGLNYKEGTLNQSRWYDGTWATWTSSTFSYKAGLTIHSTHDVGVPHAVPVPPGDMASTNKSTNTDNFRCSWCHDVHGILDANTTGPYPRMNAVIGYSSGASVAWTSDSKVFLRGPWYSSPYWEDGAPGTGTGNNTGGFTHPANSEGIVDGTGGATASGTWGGSGSWNADQTAGDLVGPNHIVRLQGLTTVTNRGADDTDWPGLTWGVHIDDNVYGTTGYAGHNPHSNNDSQTGGAALNDPSHINYSTETNLCMKCHGDLSNLVSLWSGHNAVHGGTSSLTADIYTGNMAVNQHFQYNRWEDNFTPGGTSDTGYAGELSSDPGWGSGSYYNWSVDLKNQSAAGQALDDQASIQQVYAGGSLDADANFSQSFHKFTCSKCHSPHASANARLMVTNCMNRDGTGANTFNMREGGPGLIASGTPARAYTNVIGAAYPEPQNATGREVDDPWLGNFPGQVRAVHCHNNMTPGQGDSGTFWQSIP
jgi:hypothetical protein